MDTTQLTANVVTGGSLSSNVTQITITANVTQSSIVGADIVVGGSGPRGIQGATIHTGIGVPNSSLGNDGDYYMNTGNADWYGPKTAGAWGSPTINLTGPQGIQGIQGIQGVKGDTGATILHGAVDPTTEGLDGDYYLNTVSGDWFGPKASGTWGAAITNLTGPQGIQGIQGIQGPTGPPGTVWHSGTGAPAGGTGVVGDFYFDQDSGDYYEKTGASTWTPIGNLNINLTTPIKNETPGGLINGSNTTFTTANGYVSGTLEVYRNGIRLKGGGDDYTETVGGFTMTTAPATGARLLVDYFESTTAAFDETSSVITSEVPSGTVNGTNKVFTTGATKFVAGSLQVWVNGLLQAPTDHYTETDPSAGTFTFVDAPETGDNILVAYMVANFGTGNADMLDGQHASAFADTTSVQTLSNKTVVSEDWHWIGDAGEPNYENSWVDYGGEYSGAGFKKDAVGNVYLTGLVKSGTVNTAIFTLPVGYRPAYRKIFATTSNNVHARFDVQPSGVVSTTNGSNAWVSLDGITFPAEQ